MLSYVLLTITLVSAIAGSFFEKIRKDTDGKVVRGPFNLPLLTMAGYTILLLFVSSFSFSVMQARHTANEAVAAKRNADEEKAALKISLDQTTGELIALQKLDLEKFEQNAAALKATTDGVSRKLVASSTLLSGVVRTSSEDIDKNVRGSMRALTDFRLTVFVTRSNMTKRALGRGAYEGYEDDLALFSSIVCAAPVPLTLTLAMAMAEAPNLNLMGTYKKTSSACKSEIHIEIWNGPKASMEKASLYASPKGTIYDVFDVTSANLKDVMATYTMTLSIFRPQRGANIILNVNRPKNMSVARSYIQTRLPMAMGFHVEPRADNGRIALTDLSASQAYILRSRKDNVGYGQDIDDDDNDSVQFVYERARMLPEWSWGWTQHEQNQHEKLLKNPYKLQAVQRGDQ